jgi:tRNA threonylcarbamoyladenosine biosynthesis protein TsaE
MMSVLYTATLNEQALIAQAQKLAKILRAGDVLALSGDLGTGKSTFTRAAIQAITTAKDVPSPTFTLVQSYEGAATTIYHFDLYRLKKPDEVFELGWEDALTGIVFVEWPERIGTILPSQHLAIQLDFSEDSAQRRISIKGHDSWAQRLSHVLPPTAKT